MICLFEDGYFPSLLVTLSEIDRHYLCFFNQQTELGRSPTEKNSPSFDAEQLMKPSGLCLKTSIYGTLHIFFMSHHGHVGGTQLLVKVLWSYFSQ
jgi:hypothetical protein